MLHRFLQAARAEVIGAAFEHGELEVHRLRQRAQNAGQHWQILFRKLLLQINGVRGDDGLFLFLNGEKNRRYEIRKAFADASASFDGEVLAIFERARDCDGHLLLLGAELEVLGAGEDAFLGKDFLDLFDEVEGAATGLCFGKIDHARAGK